jgi:hypothetical protein
MKFRSWLICMMIGSALFMASALSTAADDLTLELTSITSPAAPGSEFSVTIKTQPGATCTLYSIIPDTGSRSRYPERRTVEADSEGRARWSWNLHRFTREGDGYVEVFVEFQGETLKRIFPFHVTKQG